MTDEVENSVEVEVAPIETTEEHVEAEPQVNTQVDGRQEINFKAMRQRQKELEAENRRKDEMIERLVSLTSSPKTSIAEEPEESEDEFATYGKAKKAASKVVAPFEKRLKDLESNIAVQKQMALMNDLRRKYPDFEDIVNNDSLSLLEEQEPELATSIAETKDPYKMAIQSYKYIKALKLVDEVPKARHAREVEKKIEKNAKTVQSPTSYDKRPMAQAFRLTEQDKNALYEEMNQFARMAGSAPEMT